MSAAKHDADSRGERFVRLLASIEQRLAGYVLALVPNWSDAEEVIQETKVRLWEQFDRYEADKDFGAWACTIAYYQVLTHRNRQTARPALSGLSQDFFERVAAELERVSDIADSRCEALAECLRKCDERKRGLIRRYYGGGETVEQIARGLGRRAEAVRQELSRTRRALHDCIERTLEEQGDRP